MIRIILIGVTTEQIGAATEADLNAHIDDKNNPHGVTASKVVPLPKRI